MSENNKPLETIRDGRLKANIWQNEGENGPYLSVTFAKTYTDKNDQPRDSQSFSDTDLLKVAELARETYAAARHIKYNLKNDYEQARSEERETRSHDQGYDMPEEAQPRQRSRTRSYSR